MEIPSPFLISKSMSRKYNTPSEVRELDKLITSFAERFGLDRITVFRDLLRFVINGWTLPGYPGIEDWRYNLEQNALFAEMNRVWIRIMGEQLNRKEFFDVFAHLYPAYSGDKDRQSKGQFMTPHHIAQLMAELVPTDTSKVNSVCDPTGGSGGLMLASHARNPRNFHVSMDVDYSMCLQAVCNFIIHGVVGMVVCINTISQKNFKGAWLVNELLYRTGFPTIRPLSEEEYLIHSNSDKLFIYFLDAEDYDRLESVHTLLAKIHDSTTNPL